MTDPTGAAPTNSAGPTGSTSTGGQFGDLVVQRAETPCPNCGYCPCCGRRAAERWYPWMPYTPSYPPMPTYPWWSYANGSHTVTMPELHGNARTVTVTTPNPGK